MVALKAGAGRWTNAVDMVEDDNLVCCYSFGDGVRKSCMLMVEGRKWKSKGKEVSKVKVWRKKVWASLISVSYSTAVLVS